MDQKTFAEIVKAQLGRSEDLLITKGKEYAEGPDRLFHFKKAAVLQEVTYLQAAFGMLTKHLISLSDMIKTRKPYPIERWNEKITDSINYLLIIRALVEEEEEAWPK